jgi:hypothetical protein
MLKDLATLPCIKMKTRLIACRAALHIDVGPFECKTRELRLLKLQTKVGNGLSRVRYRDLSQLGRG